MLRESTRNEDLVARYGGEEFVLALPVAAPDQASVRGDSAAKNSAMRSANVGAEAATGRRAR